jgi:hypothetical protein
MDGLTLGLIQTGGYIVVIIIAFGLMNFLTKGFIWEYLKVKLSRGKKILVKAHDVTDSYYIASKIDAKKNLLVKDRAKNIFTFSDINISYIRRELGLNIIEVDLTNQTLIKRDFSESTGFDLTATDNMINRAVMLPKLGEEKLSKEMIIAIITLIAVIGVIIALVMSPDFIASKVAEKVAQKMLSSATGGTI